MTVVKKTKSPPLLTIKDISKYTEAPKLSEFIPSKTIPAERGDSSTDDRKHVCAILPSTAGNDIKHFRESLPKEIAWLLYPNLPISKDYLRTVLFFYDFGTHSLIDKDLLKSEPWRDDPKNNQILTRARKEFISKIKELGGIVKYLTTRELKYEDPRFILDEYQLALPQIAAMGTNANPLWRYMSLAKFASLISTSTLWFSRPSKFSDPFESKTNQKSKVKHLMYMMTRLIEDYNLAVREDEDIFLRAHEDIMSELKKNDQGEIIQHEYDELSDVPIMLRLAAEDILNESLDSILVNCWHQNSSESEAMWRLYTDYLDGVAIVSSFDNLRNSFSGDYNQIPSILSIDYHDLHESDEVFPFLPTAYKHKAFEHEKEVRAFLPAHDLDKNVPGITVPVNLEQMIDRIIIAPNAQGWFEDSVKWILDKAGLAYEVEYSIFSQKLY